MNTATITWIAYENYGTYLQAYALQQIIKSLGHKNHIIYDSYFAKYAPDRVSMKERIKEILCAFIYKKHHLAHLKYKLFEHRFLKVDYSVKTINGLGKRYDAFICGSDQIWSPYLEFEPYYYLGFDARKKIAYAPSLGTDKCDKAYELNAIPLIKQFDCISVRETTSAQLLSKYIDKEITTVVDPTLLLNSGQWSKITKKVKEQDYILCYFLTANKWYMDYAKALASSMHKKLLCFRNHPEYGSLTDNLIDGGPAEFLSYIHNANLVLTDSFHASVFSLLFHKDFYTFKRFKDGGELDQNARIYNLFSKLGIEGRFIGESELNLIKLEIKLNYKDIDNILEQERQESLNYLTKALNS